MDTEMMGETTGVETKEIVAKEAFVLDKIEKAIYMGFLLDEQSNNYIRKEFQLDITMVEKYIANYNKSIANKGYAIFFEFDAKRQSIKFRLYGEVVYVYGDKFPLFMSRVERRIVENLALAAQSYAPRGIELYDLDLLVELKRTGVTTMGNTYLGFNRKKYIVNFVHLYSITNNYH